MIAAAVQGGLSFNLLDLVSNKYRMHGATSILSLDPLRPKKLRVLNLSDIDA